MSFIQQHAYLFLLVLTTTEGPITSFVSAGFAAQGLLRIEYVFGIAVLWDILWDVFLYILGRFLYKISRVKKRHKNMTQKNIFKNIYKKYPFIYFLIVKITPYLSSTSLISTGIKKMKFFVFLLYSISISIIVKTVYVWLGYLWSISIGQLKNFLEWRKMGVLYIITGIFLFRCSKKFYQRVSNKLRKKVEIKKK